MYQELLDNASLPTFLIQIDQELADKARGQGCWACGAVVHRADYPRLVRGGPWPLDEAHDRRFSFCCSKEGCRRRLTPPSVRFIKRHIYLSVVVVLAGYLLQGPTPWRVSHLSEKLCVSRRTLVRWRRWWQETLAQTKTWQKVQGRFFMPADGQLPAAALHAMQHEPWVDRVVALLK